MKNYIGISSSHHDSAIAIVNCDGDVVFAEATERYMQNKRATNIAPDVAHRISKLMDTYCDPDSEIVAAYTWSDEVDKSVEESLVKLKQIKRESGSVLSPLHVNLISFVEGMGHYQLQAMKSAGLRLEDELARDERWSNHQIQTRRYNHHLTHAATACYTSPFSEGVCAIIDGYGEGRSNDLFVYRNGKIENIFDETKNAQGSLGLYYQLMCEVCGFKPDQGEEWKVMGLAPYGQVDEKLYNTLKKLLKTDGIYLHDGNPWEVGQAMHELDRVKRKPGDSTERIANIACTAQLFFEEVFIEMLDNVSKLGISRNLILGGGCMLNSSATGKVLQNTDFDAVHVYAAPGDDGNALGAALLAYYEDSPRKAPANNRPMTPYLGSKMAQETLGNMKRFGPTNYLKSYPGKVHQKAAELLAEGKIIGWVQGRAEFGPRSLGNRSILACARTAKVKDEINSRVKFREEFRPFAPSILHEYGKDYFENYQSSPYMERTLQFRPEVVDKVPGVVHVNGTGRLQSVTREMNQRYYDLIEAYREFTGIPLVLNTSFNVMGKPIIHSVEDAIAVFYTTGLDALVIGDEILTKH